MHLFKEFNRYRKSGALANYRVDAAIRANSCPATVAVVAAKKPVLDLRWLEYFKAIEAAAGTVFFQLGLMIAGEKMSFFQIEFFQFNTSK